MTTTGRLLRSLPSIDGPSGITIMGLSEHTQGCPPRVVTAAMTPPEYDAFIADLGNRIDADGDVGPLNERTFGASIIVLDFDFEKIEGINATSRDRQAAMIRLVGSLTDILDQHFTGYISNQVNLYVSGENRYHVSIPDALCLFTRMGKWLVRMLRQYHNPMEDCEYLDVIDFKPLSQRHMRLLGTFNASGGGRYRQILGNGFHSIVPRAALWSRLLAKGDYLKAKTQVAMDLMPRQTIDSEWDIVTVCEGLYPESLETRFTIDSDSETEPDDGEEERERQITNNQADVVFTTREMVVVWRDRDDDQMCWSGRDCDSHQAKAIIDTGDHYRIISHCPACRYWATRLEIKHRIETDND